MRIKIELWMGLGKELGGDFTSPSELRSELMVNVEEGITTRMLFNQLADRYKPIGQRIFDKNKGVIFSNVIPIFNDKVITAQHLYERTLKDGDKIRLVPVHSGG